MPSFATIEKVEDLYNRCTVLFEDTDSNKQTRVTVDLNNTDYQNDADLYDHIALFWPYDFFAKPPKKRPEDMHQAAKNNVGDRENISGRVVSGAP